MRSSSPAKQQASPLDNNIFTSSSLLDTLALSGHKQTTDSTTHTLSESVSNQRPATGSIPTAQSLRSVPTAQEPSVEAMNEPVLAGSSYSPLIKPPSSVIIAKHKKTSRSSRRSPEFPVTSRDVHRRAHVIKQSSSTFNTGDLPGSLSTVRMYSIPYCI